MQRLFAAERATGSAGQHRATIVSRCEDYSIVSEYASFIVLENDAEYRRWAIDRKNVGRLQRDRAARDRRREQLRELRDQALATLGPAQNETTDNITDKQILAQESVAQRRRSSKNVPSPLPQVARRPAKSPMNFSIPGNQGGGGGAIDPVSGTLLLTLTGLGAWAKRRRMTVPQA